MLFLLCCPKLKEYLDTALTSSAAVTAVTETKYCDCGFLNFLRQANSSRHARVHICAKQLLCCWAHLFFDFILSNFTFDSLFAASGPLTCNFLFLQDLPVHYHMPCPFPTIRQQKSLLRVVQIQQAFEMGCVSVRMVVWFPRASLSCLALS